MKTQLLKRAMLVIAMPVIYFIVVSGLNSPESFFEKAISITTDSAGKDFINLIFTDTYFGRTNSSDPRAIENNLGNFTDSLHFNSIHVYGYDTTGGGINSDTSWYQSYVSGLMNQVKNAGLNGYWGRNTIERLSYGQRLEYEIKQTNGSRVNTGFCYDTTMASTYGTDSGKTVLHPTISGNSAGWLCKSIYENLQHGDLIDFTQLDDSTWFIKPVMRIDSNIVDSNPEDSVVRIDIINYSGKTIKSIKIKARNFAKKLNDSTYLYQGNYVNIFDFTDEPFGTNLEVMGKSYDTSGIGLNYGMRSNSWPKWKNNCKVDFKVWWYGKVEVSFDKMVVDDYWGNKLFSGEMDGKIKDGSTEQNFNSLLYQLRYDKNIKSSNYPCINYVFNKMEKYINPIQYAQSR